MNRSSLRLIIAAPLAVALLAAVPYAAAAEGSGADPTSGAGRAASCGRINGAGLWEWIGHTRRSPTIQYINPTVPPIELPAYKGTRYEADVPDTLDLAERAALAAHGLTAATDADADYEIYFAARLQLDPPAMFHSFDDICQHKWHEALPLMRLASGSRLNEQVDRRWMEVVMQMQGPDGLLYLPLTGRPWARGIPSYWPGKLPAKGDQYSSAYWNGRMLAAIALYYKLTGEERWKQLGIRIVDGLARQAVNKGDYAYFATLIHGVNEALSPDTPLGNGWFQMHFSWVYMGLAQFYRVTGYEPALALSGKLARCVRYKSGLFAADGRWSGGHFHGHLYPLLGMLEYGAAANDAAMIQFAKTGYECAKAKMNPVVGYVGELDAPNVFSETCGVADMIALALKLTHAGVGDYLDDVDRWTRNQFAENQLTSCAWVPELPKPRPSASDPQESSNAYAVGQLKELLGKDQVSASGVTIDRVPERCLGVFASYPSANQWLGPCESGNHNAHSGCCTGNGSRTIYYVWKNILRYQDGKLRVNLLLNRASPWADVDSSIPYEGRVDVKIKEACELSVRIPEWVKPDEARCYVNGADRPLSWEGRYAVTGKVEPKDVATLTFPIFERTDKVHIQGKEYTLIRKGNDVVQIDPPGKYCPLYQREKYRENKARTKKVERFVAQQQIDW